MEKTIVMSNGNDGFATLFQLLKHDFVKILSKLRILIGGHFIEQ